MRKATCFLLGCAATVGSTGCSLLLNLDPVNDNTSGAPGIGNGGGGGLGGKANGGTDSSGGKAGSVANGGTDSSGGKAGGVANGGVAGSVATTSSAAGSTSLSGGTGGTTSVAGAAGIYATQAGVAGIASTIISGGTAGAAGQTQVGTGGTAGSSGLTGNAGVSGTVANAGAAGMTAAIQKSCQNLATQCQGESCCTSINMSGGKFSMGRGEQTTASDYFLGGDANELPEHSATVASFALDKYEVTVGRFRKFVDSYDDWHVTKGNPLPNAGAHPIAVNTGWDRGWIHNASDLPVDSAALSASVSCSPDNQTWTNAADVREAYPMSCVTWYVAFAFCIWDGGRLPTEAEWEYAAVGGSENRLYPWGSSAPDNTRAVFYDTDRSPFIPVGSKGASGASYFGHQDLAGSVWEWVLDWYSPSFYGSSGTPTICSNCANSDDSSLGIRVLRGDGWRGSAIYLRGASRFKDGPGVRYSDYGFRCVRTVQ